MRNLADIKELSRATGLHQRDLLALDPANDPYAADRRGRRAAAEWFTRLFEQFGFGAGVHLRRIHYRIISQPEPVLKPDGREYQNTDACWDCLVSASRDARYLGLVPAAAFVDRRNPDPQLFVATERRGWVSLDEGNLYLASPDERFPDLPALQFSSPTVAAPYLVEVWCEKSTMDDVLLPICRRYGANLVTGAGEMSETATRLFVGRARAAGRPARILYLSDFDPAGRSMPVAVARKIEYAIRDSNSLDVRLRPIVLTEEQCKTYRLPRTPIKDTETRAPKFEARFGTGATELDALEALHPGELDRIVKAEIERYIDLDHSWHVSRAASEYNQRLKEVTSKVHDKYRGDVEELEEEYRRLIRFSQDFNEKA